MTGMPCQLIRAATHTEAAIGLTDLGSALHIHKSHAVHWTRLVGSVNTDISNHFEQHVHCCQVFTRVHPTENEQSLVATLQAVPENQRREAIFKGLCIARTWRGWRSTFTVRNFITGGGGIERVFQL